MDIITINENEKAFEFICDSRGTRTGFAHDCHLFIDGIEKTDAHCYYINRTWEWWCYQTVCLKAINNLIESHTDRKKRAYLHEHDYKKMTAKRAQEFNAALDTDDYMSMLRAVKANLNEHVH